MKFVYTYSLNKAITTGNFFYGVWRLNSPYDPDTATLGVSAWQWSMWGNFYQSYRVHAAKFRVICRNTTGNPSGVNSAVDFVTIASPNYNIWGASTPDTDEMCKMPWSKRVTTLSLDKTVKVIKGYYHMAKLGGFSNVEWYTSPAFTADWSKNPVQMNYLHVVAACPGQSAFAFAMNMELKITYYVECYNRYIPTPNQTAEELTETDDKVKVEVHTGDGQDI